MKKIKTVGIILAVISLPLISSLAHAAQYSFIPRLNVDSYYTDNIFLTPDNTESDIVTTVIPGFTAGVAGQTAGLDIRFDPGYTVYKDNTDLNYWQIQCRPERFRGYHPGYDPVCPKHLLSHQEIRTPRPSSMTSGQTSRGYSVDPTVRQGRDKYWRNNFSARADHQLGLDKSIFAEYRNQILRNDNTATI